MEKLIEKLRKGNYSCVVENGERVQTFTRRGVIDLYELLNQQPEWLKGARLADKIVGKAAAALMILGGVKVVHAELISIPAIELLQANRVEITFAKSVPYIINRSGDGWCPMEQLALNVHSPQEIYPLVDSFLQRVMFGNK
ncbi:MAG: DUF1893 domain-containing protein [Phocaeicola sp.]